MEDGQRRGPRVLALLLALAHQLAEAVRHAQTLLLLLPSKWQGEEMKQGVYKIVIPPEDETNTSVSIRTRSTPDTFILFRKKECPFSADKVGTCRAAPATTVTPLFALGTHLPPTNPRQILIFAGHQVHQAYTIPIPRPPSPNCSTEHTVQNAYGCFRLEPPAHGGRHRTVNTATTSLHCRANPRDTAPP